MAKIRKIQTSVTLPADIVARIQEESFGDSVSAVIADRLRQAFAMGPRQQGEPSPMDDLDMRKKAAEVEMSERRAAIMRREYVRRDEALAAVAVDFANIRSRVAQIPRQIANLTREQEDDGDRAVQECFTDLSCEKPATWDDLAENASRNLP
jgi:hypothetical protein